MVLNMLVKKKKSNYLFQKGREAQGKIDITGKRSGKLVAIKRSDKVDSNSYRSYWECLCDCGKTAIVITSKLQNNSAKSCGCLKRRHGKDNHRYNGVGEVTGSYVNNISSAAIKAGKEWNISKEYLSNLYEKQKRKCALSGIDICFGDSRRMSSKTTASLDRLDNSQGYIEGNVQWVHKDINKMRGKLPISDFLKICKHIVMYNENNQCPV